MKKYLISFLIIVVLVFGATFAISLIKSLNKNEVNNTSLLVKIVHIFRVNFFEHIWNLIKKGGEIGQSKDETSNGADSSGDNGNNKNIKTSSFSLGTDFDPKFDFSYLTSFTKNGIYSFGSEKEFWGLIEPSKGKYDWANYDSKIKKVETVKGDIYPTIWSGSEWGSSAETLKPSSIPKSEYRQNYKDFIKSFMERYDKDGENDMPGLEYAHNYLQIEDEAQNLGDAWQASSNCDSKKTDQTAYYQCGAQEYGETLKLAYEGARETNPNSKIISFSFNPGDYFDQNIYPSISPNSNPKVAFFDYVFKNYNSYFDTIGVNCNYGYQGIPGFISYVRNTYKLNKPIMCVDAGTMPMLTRSQFIKQDKYLNKYPFMSDSDILAVLDNGTSDPKFAEIKPWWEGEKSKISVKKAVVAKGAGVEKLFLQFGIAEPKTHGLTQNPWTHSGLISSGMSKMNDGSIGTPRTILYAAEQLVEKTDDLNSIQNLNPLPLDSDPKTWIWIYKFNSRDKTVYIAWKDEQEGKADLSSFIGKGDVKITPMVTKLDSSFNPIYEKSSTVSSGEVPLSSTPVYIE